MASILILRHPEFHRHFYDHVLAWLVQHFPALLPHFELRDLPCTMLPLDRLRLLVPWLQDPVQAWSPDTYRHLEELSGYCDAARIPVINRVEHLVNAGKHLAAQRIAEAGFRTPQTVLIDNGQQFREGLGGLELPLFLREDWQHGGSMLRANTKDEACALPIEQFRRPLAMQLIDVRSASDGLLRKYRYFACGGFGVSQHLQVSAEWITRGDNRIKTPETQAEELAYIGRPDPHHARFQRALQTLSLDMAAFDYGYDHQGEVVVWEVNPFPHFNFSTGDLVYRNRAMHRSAAAMIGLYLQRAGLPVPEALMKIIGY